MGEDLVDPRCPWTALRRHAVVVSFNLHILDYMERTVTELEEEETPPNIPDEELDEVIDEGVWDCLLSPFGKG